LAVRLATVRRSETAGVHFFKYVTSRCVRVSSFVLVTRTVTKNFDSSLAS